MIEEFLKTILTFPTKERVETVCKPGKGKKTCRYLTLDPGKGFCCAKADSTRRMIDKRSEEGSMNARGDNCEGLLGIIIKEQNVLIGKRILWEETSPTFEDEGIVEALEINNEMLEISLKWKDRESDNIGFNVSHMEVSVLPDRIVFSLAGLGSFGGKASILLNA